MSISRKLLMFIVLLCAALVVEQSMGAPGGRGGRDGGRGFGGMGGGWGRWFQQSDADRKKEEESRRKKADEKQIREKADKLLAEGWACLKVGDTLAAVDAFEDVLELKPDAGNAKLGIGLSKAREQKFPQAIQHLEAAAKMKGTERLANYNLAVVYTRINQKPRAVMALNKQMAMAPDPVDEMVENAALSLLGVMDEPTKKSMGSLALVQKTLAQQEKTLQVSKYEGKERWGIAWVPLGAASKMRAAQAQLLYPAEIPFVLPDMSVLSFKRGEMTANVLLPEIAGEAGKLMLASVEALAPNTTLASETPAKPTVATPIAGAPNTTIAAVTPKPAVDPRVGPAPAVPAAPAPAAPSAGITAFPGATTQPAEQQIITVRGAAFAVTPDLLVTCERIIAGAETISVSDVDGVQNAAEVIASDPVAGLALIKVTGTKFQPMPLADACKSGPSGVACFARASVFAPELSIVRGDLAVAGAGKFTLRMSIHPRSAGCPVADEQGRVLALVSATRTDTMDKLPVIPIDVVKKFLAGKVPSFAAAAVDPNEAVAEVTVTKKQ